MPGPAASFREMTVRETPKAGRYMAGVYLQSVSMLFFILSREWLTSFGSYWFWKLWLPGFNFLNSQLSIWTELSALMNIVRLLVVGRPTGRKWLLSP